MKLHFDNQQTGFVFDTMAKLAQKGTKSQSEHAKVIMRKIEEENQNYNYGLIYRLAEHVAGCLTNHDAIDAAKYADRAYDAAPEAVQVFNLQDDVDRRDAEQANVDLMNLADDIHRHDINEAMLH